MPDGTFIEQGVADLFAARSRAEILAHALDQRIRAQRLTAGERLGTFASLRAESGYAYATISEAVRLLRDRGVLEIRPGRGGGLFVTDRDPVVRLRHTLLSVTENPETVADAIELRDHLELLIDVGAARHRTSDDIVDLRRLLEQMRTAHGWEGFMRANWRLHARIAAVSPNAMARVVYTSALGHLAPSAPDLDDPDAQGYRDRRQRIHTDLVDAISDGDETRVRAAVALHGTPPSRLEERR